MFIMLFLHCNCQAAYTVYLYRLSRSILGRPPYINHPPNKMACVKMQICNHMFYFNKLKTAATERFISDKTRQRVF